MNILFVHNSFPAQYLHLAPAMAARGHGVVGLTLHDCPPVPGVTIARYTLKRGNSPGVHPLAQEFEAKVARGESAASAALALKNRGFSPDVICAHPGWGEALYLKDVWPKARLLSYFEFFYRAEGADVGFDAEFAGSPLEAAVRMRSKNANNLLALDAADHGISPTRWQRSLFPAWAQSRISVIHDGIDTALAAPDANACLRLDGPGLELRAGDEIVTFVSRNLEPYRGFHIFMRALPSLLKQRPNAQIIILGGDKVSYGSAPASGRTWKEELLKEVGQDLDMRRVHFLGNVPYPVYLRLLQVSAAHVYLTYPFVLSWSLLEAMSAGCLVIGSRTPPVEEVMRDGENGILVDFFDHAALADTVAAALAKRGSHTRLRMQARETILANYDLKRICLPQQIELVESLA